MSYVSGYGPGYSNKYSNSGTPVKVKVRGKVGGTGVRNTGLFKSPVVDRMHASQPHQLGIDPLPEVPFSHLYLYLYL